MKFHNPERIVRNDGFAVIDHARGDAGEMHATMFIGTTAALIMGGLAAAGGIAKGIGASAAASAEEKAAKNANQMQWNLDARNQAALSPYTTSGRYAADKLDYLLGLPSATGDTTSVRNSLIGAGSSQDALQTALRMNDPRVSPNAETTQQWISQGIPFDNVNGIAVRKDMGTPGAGGPGAAYGDNGDGAFGSLMKPFTGKDVATDPGYQFGLDQGTKAIQRAAAARGATFNGSTLKALDTFSTDYAGTKFNDAFNRNMSTNQFKLGSLMGLIGVGQNATNTGVQATANTGAAVNRNDLAIGDARASGDLGIAGAVSGGLNGIMNAYLMANPGAGSGVTPGQINAADYARGANTPGANTLANIPMYTPGFNPAAVDPGSSPLTKLRIN